MNLPTLFCTIFTFYLYTFVCMLFLFNFKSPQTILIEQIFEKIRTIRFVAPSSIFRIFLGIFYFLNSNLNFEFGPAQTETGPDRFDPPVWWTMVEVGLLPKRLLIDLLTGGTSSRFLICNNCSILNEDNLHSALSIRCAKDLPLCLVVFLPQDFAQLVAPLNGAPLNGISEASPPEPFDSILFDWALAGAGGELELDCSQRGS